MTDHPNADDYRNRAERAEQEAAELRKLADGMAEALTDFRHAVTSETGFAQAVRGHSGLGYPWPAMDLADERAVAALALAANIMER